MFQKTTERPVKNLCSLVKETEHGPVVICNLYCCEALKESELGCPRECSLFSWDEYHYAETPKECPAFTDRNVKVELYVKILATSEHYFPYEIPSKLVQKDKQ